MESVVGCHRNTHRISPNQIFLIINAANQVVSDGMPEEPGGGTGKKTITFICSTYQLDLDTIIQELAKQNINVEAAQTLQQAGEINRLGPEDIYQVIREISLR